MSDRTPIWTTWTSHEGNADLVVQSPDGSSFAIASLDLDWLQAVCPLFALSFDQLKNGRHRLKLSDCSVELAHRFLRFLDTGDYVKTAPDIEKEVPCSLPMYAQLYHFGVLYDCAELVGMAHRDIWEVCENACCVPRPPEGLVETIRFLYARLRSNFEIRETILHYCVQCFCYHRLAELPGFLALLADFRDFELDLFRINMLRDFRDTGDDASSQIIQLPANPPQQTDLGTVDFLYLIFGSNASTPMTTPLVSPVGSTASAHSMCSPFTVVHRPRRQDGSSGTDESDGYSSDASAISDFQLIGHPRQEVHQSSLPHRPLVQTAEASRRSEDPSSATANRTLSQELQEMDDTRPRQEMLRHSILPHRPLLKSARPRPWSDDSKPPDSATTATQIRQRTDDSDDEEEWSSWDDGSGEEDDNDDDDDDDDDQDPPEKSPGNPLYSNEEAAGSAETIVAISRGSVEDVEACEVGGTLESEDGGYLDAWEQLEGDAQDVAKSPGR